MASDSNQTGATGNFVQDFPPIQPLIRFFEAGSSTSNGNTALPGPPSPPLSLAPTTMTTATHWTQMPAMPDPNQIKDILTSMQETLENLGVNFSSLERHTTQVARLQTDFDYTAQITSLRKHMVMSDAKHEQKMEEIKVLLKDVLKEEVVPYINEMIASEVDAQMEATIEQLVQDEIMLQLPEHLRLQIVEHKKQLHEVQVSLHNSEARRANALLRSSHLKDPLHPLIGPQGVISPNFPRDLTALFALDAAAAKALNEEYGLPDIGESRERNLNRFMQYCGVAYQMTPAGHFQRPGSQGKLAGVRNPSLRKVRFLASPVSPSWSSTDSSFTLAPSPPDSPAFSVPGAFPDPDELDEQPGARLTVLVPRSRLRRPVDSFGVKFIVGLLAATSQLTAMYLAAELWC